MGCLERRAAQSVVAAALRLHHRLLLRMSRSVDGGLAALPLPPPLLGRQPAGMAKHPLSSRHPLWRALTAVHSSVDLPLALSTGHHGANHTHLTAGHAACTAGFLR